MDDRGDAGDGSALALDGGAGDPVDTKRPREAGRVQRSRSDRQRPWASLRAWSDPGGPPRNADRLDGAGRAVCQGKVEPTAGPEGPSGRPSAGPSPTDSLVAWLVGGSDPEPVVPPVLLTLSSPATAPGVSRPGRGLRGPERDPRPGRGRPFPPGAHGAGRAPGRLAPAPGGVGSARRPARAPVWQPDPAPPGHLPRPSVPRCRLDGGDDSHRRDLAGLVPAGGNGPEPPRCAGAPDPVDESGGAPDPSGPRRPEHPRRVEVRPGHRVGRGRTPGPVAGIHPAAGRLHSARVLDVGDPLVRGAPRR